MRRKKEKGKRKDPHVFLAVAVALLLPAFASADPRELVEQGKLLYSQQKYENAQKTFHEAGADVPSSSPDAQLLQFNEAATYYQRDDYDKAIELYEKSLLTVDPQVEAQTKYNLGNCYFHKARLQGETDPKTAIEQLDKAMTYYRDAMESLENPADARYNLEKSKLLKKDLIDKAKKQQDEQKKKEPGDEENKPKKEGDEEQKDEGKQDEQKKDEQQQQQAGDDQKDEQDQKDQQQQAGEEKQQELSPEDAQKLLNAIREKQQQNEREERVRQPAGYAPVDRDW